MKILIASDLYWPVINGVSTFSRNLALGLAERGHEVLVIAPSQVGKKHTEVDGKYKIARTATVIFPFYQNYRISLSPYREVKKIIDEFQPDVIHIQMLLMIGQAVMKYGNKKGIPIISTNHVMPENLMDNLKMLAPVSRPISYVLKKYGQRFFSKSDLVTMPTQAAIDMSRKEVDKMTIPIIPVSNGIDLSRFSPGNPDQSVVAKFKIPTKYPVITFVGRVDAEKHVSVLVNAFSKVLKKVEARLMIVGSGIDVPNLEELSKQLGIEDKVIFTGRVSDKELEELHKVTTVFCMPSPAELQSIAMLEAMASGKPVVAVDAGALKELCQDKRNGFLCAKDDVEGITNGLIKLLTDKKLYDVMSKESLAIAATHDLNHTLTQFEKIYKDVIKSKKN
ncbi:MAG: glycosyltransferase [Thiobacillus sp.]